MLDRSLRTYWTRSLRRPTDGELARLFPPRQRNDSARRVRSVRASGERAFVGARSTTPDSDTALRNERPHAVAAATATKRVTAPVAGKAARTSSKPGKASARTAAKSAEKATKAAEKAPPTEAPADEPAPDASALEAAVAVEELEPEGPIDPAEVDEESAEFA